jgi:hypothetical protein
VIDFTARAIATRCVSLIAWSLRRLRQQRRLVVIGLHLGRDPLQHAVEQRRRNGGLLEQLGVIDAPDVARIAQPIDFGEHRVRAAALEEAGHALPGKDAALANQLVDRGGEEQPAFRLVVAAHAVLPIAPLDAAARAAQLDPRGQHDTVGDGHRGPFFDPVDPCFVVAEPERTGPLHRELLAVVRPRHVPRAARSQFLPAFAAGGRSGEVSP